MLDRNNLGQVELRTIVGVSDKTVSSWEINRTEPKMRIVQQLADYFNVTTDFLIKGNNDEKIYQSAGIDYIYIPLYDILCYGNVSFVDDDIIEMIPVPSKGLNLNLEYFCQYADDESMKGARINDSDLLVFEKTDKVDYGVIGCFCTDDNIAVCKKFTEMNGIMMLQPMNSNFHLYQ